MSEQGVPYEASSPLRCQYILDDTRFNVRLCNECTIRPGYSWCAVHLAEVVRPDPRKQKAAA